MSVEDRFVDVDQRRLDGELWAVSPKEGVMTAEALHHVLEGLLKAAPEKRFVVFAGPVDLVPVTSLDAAWKAAEAAAQALGPDWHLAGVHRDVDGETAEYRGYRASANNGKYMEHIRHAESPEAALRALAASLATPVTPEGGER